MYGNGEPRLNVLRIPRRQHAGKTSVENLDYEYQKEQAKLQAKMKARSEVLAAYERHIGPSYSPITGTPMGTPRTRVGMNPDQSEVGSTTVEVDELPETPVAMRHKRRDSGCINLFAPPPVLKPDTSYKVRPPFATDDETPRKYTPQRRPAPFATDEDDDGQPSTKPASTKPPVNFCWRWAFQDDEGNPIPEEEEPNTPVHIATPDFSSMSPRGSPKYLQDNFTGVEDDE